MVKDTKLTHMCHFDLGFLCCVHTGEHELVGVVRQGEDVRRHLHPLLPSVGSHHLRVVDRQPFVGIHRHTEEPGVGLRGISQTAAIASDPSVKYLNNRE